jgi:hypothetical protein
MTFKSGWDKLGQRTRETLGSGDKTSISSDLLETVRTAEVIKKNYEAIISKTEAYLNSSGRFNIFNSKEKLTRLPVYLLASSLKEASTNLDGDNDLSSNYNECSEMLMELAQYELDFDMEVRSKFLQPKIDFVKTYIKEAFHQYDKLKSRRLDYDAKRHKLKEAKPDKAPKYEMELQLSQRKLEESTEVCRQYFSYIVDQKERTLAQRAELMSFMQAMKVYYELCYEKLKALDDQWQFSENMTYVSPFKPPTIDRNYNSPILESSSGLSVSSNYNRSPTPPPLPTYRRLPQCRALYDFKAQQSGDLELHVGDIIEITHQTDKDWWEGMVDGRVGIFPSNYVETI